MKITSGLFQAYLKCPTKCWLRAAGEVPIGNTYAGWVKTQDESYLSNQAGRLVGESPDGEVVASPDAENLKSARWHATLKARTSALASEIRKRLEKVVALLSSPTPPDLVLNRHCTECEFRDRCRQKAIEADDLSLLAGMSAKERQKLRSKGIFTVTQLSYTFRPRRRPKRLRDKREKYHHALKALAIREKKIHIVGSPELKIEGTPLYLDVEGLPDRDFYYLIGLRIGNGDAAVQHSLWADTVADEAKIWREFLAILETVEKPVLIHYGSYETTFLKRMDERYGSPVEDTGTLATPNLRVNVLAFVFAQVYLPTFSNSLKDAAGFFGFSWTLTRLSGLQTIACRRRWEESQDSTIKADLLPIRRRSARCRNRFWQSASRNRRDNRSMGTEDSFSTKASK